MNAEIEKLIEMALQDNHLTDKEKEIIFRKAEKLGLDIDEVEMYIENQLSTHKSSSLTQSQAARCPNCNAEIPSFTPKCNYCGHELRNIKANSSIERLFTMLNDAESERDRVKGKGVKGFLFGATEEQKATVVINKKFEIINNFPIPNTKEDIFEFLTLALPKAKIDSFNMSSLQQAFAQAWKSKCEQVVIKAKFLFKDDVRSLAELQRVINEHQNSKSNEINWRGTIGIAIVIFIGGSVFAAMTGGVIFFGLGFIGMFVYPFYVWKQHKENQIT